MKKIYFTVGPSQIYPTLYKHLNKAIKEDIFSLNHRGEEFKKLFTSTTEGLKKLLNIPANFQIFFVSSALEGMERTIQGCSEKTSFHIITGSFGKAWANYASQLGRNVLTYNIDPTQKAELSNIKIPQRAEIICITQNDTSTGYWIPMDEIIKLKKKYPEKLVAIDVVSSVPFVTIDYKYIDIAFFSVQKGFGLPAGLGVIIASPKALEKTEKLLKNKSVIGSYHSFKHLSEKALNLQTPETPNVLNIYLLNSVIKDMLKIGINNIRQDMDKKAKALYELFENHHLYKPYVANKEFRSPTTAVFDVKGTSESLRKKLSQKGFIVGAGYGDNKLNHIRVANFPAHTYKDTLQLLKYIA
ncbi:alanine--glyoxylate aminotransferase family protein [Candidatus Daviesbacteria bacterium]|nr:alanine--glyoxylate aminotransferase family protein [Candidatus Daviesbacteria bacterium]